MLNECLSRSLAGTRFRPHIFNMRMNAPGTWMALAILAAAGSPALAQAPPIQPLDLSGIQNQYNSTVQQQNYNTQLNTFRVEQGIAQDRIRELDLTRPFDPFAPPGVFQPQPPGLPALPQQRLPQTQGGQSQAQGNTGAYQPPALPSLSRPAPPRD